jgi:predicted DsbA family dithiol-disulfide isomerase
MRRRHGRGAASQASAPAGARCIEGVRALKIDFVSDVACPWCAVGLYSLEEALRRVGPELPVQLHFQPFELNPQMPAEGEDAAEHLARKYGASPQQLAATRETLRQRGAEVGFSFGERPRVWNTFDAHRLLHWAGTQGRQRELKHALLAAYHTHAQNPGSREVLLRLCADVGLDAKRAGAILDSDEFADAVRERERFYQQQGISAVPSVIIDDRHLIQGGQPPEAFERALRQLAAEAGSND